MSYSGCTVSGLLHALQGVLLYYCDSRSTDKVAQYPNGGTKNQAAAAVL
jgi:hypothetical protein